MFKTVMRFAALVAVAVPTLAAAQEEYSSPTGTYVVEPKYPDASNAYPSGYNMNDTVPWDTGILPFSPTRVYTPTEQSTVVGDESRLLSAPVYIDPVDGKQDLDYLQKVLPEANQQNVPPATAGQPTSDTPEVFSKSYNRDESFGSDLFGGGYVINAYVTATTATTTAAKKVEALGEGYVYGKAFSLKKEIIRGRAYINGQQGGANTGTAALYAMGQQIWSANLSYTFAPTPINWSRTFFSISKTFMVGPVPLQVKASLSGGVRLTVKGEVSPTVARLTATPGGFANVSASAGINIVIASFGVSSDLRLVNADLPTTGELFWPLCSLDWKLTSDLKLNYLAGTVQAYVKVGILWWKKTWKITIATWAGYTKSFNLLNIYGTKNLGIC